jgi:Ca2+-binding EF-hand superfamily protein
VPLKERIRKLSASSTNESEPWDEQTSFGGSPPRSPPPATGALARRTVSHSTGSKQLRRQSFKMGDEELLVTALMQTSAETKETLLQTAKFTVDEIGEFEQICAKLCPDGHIAKDEFIRICTKLYAEKIFDISDYANLVYEIFDVYVNDTIRCIDYHLIQAVQCNGSPTERLQVLFRTMDQESKGHVTTKELTTLVRLVNAVAIEEGRHGMGSNQLAEMLVIELDTFGTGQVSEADFLSGVLSNDALAGVFLGNGDSVSQQNSEGTTWSVASTAVTGVGVAQHDYLGNVVALPRDRAYTGEYATPDPMEQDPPKKKGWGLRRKASSPKKKSSVDTPHFYPPDNATYFE